MIKSFAISVVLHLSDSVDITLISFFNPSTSIFIIMGASVSTCLLGFHTILELAAGSIIFYSGTAFIVDDNKDRTAIDRLWRRWHAGGLLTMAYVGYAGLTGSSSEVKSMAVTACGIFHGIATLAMMIGHHKEGAQSRMEVYGTNVHLYCALGFAAVSYGLIQ